MYTCIHTQDFVSKTRIGCKKSQIDRAYTPLPSQCAENIQKVQKYTYNNSIQKEDLKTKMSKSLNHTS